MTYNHFIKLYNTGLWLFRR